MPLYPELKIIVADDGPATDTLEIIRIKNLLTAILHRTTLDYAGIDYHQAWNGSGAKVLRDAKRFLADKSMQPYSYKWICEYLDICPKKLQLRIEDFKKLWQQGKIDIEHRYKLSRK